MSDTTDDVNVQITGSVAGLTAAMAAGASSVKAGADEIGNTLGLMVEKSDGALQLLAQDLTVKVPAAMRDAASGVGAGAEQISGALDGMSRRFTSVGVGIAFAVQGMADGAETGVNRALRAVSLLGFAFGPEVGGVTLAIALATKEMINYFTAASKAAEKAAKDFQDSVDKMVDAGAKMDLRNKAAMVWFGTPSEIAAGKAGLKGLLDQLVEAKAALADAKASGDLGLFQTATKNIKDLSAQIKPFQDQFDTLVKAMNAPMPNLGGTLDKVTTTAEGPKSEEKDETKANEESNREQRAQNEMTWGLLEALRIQDLENAKKYVAGLMVNHEESFSAAKGDTDRQLALNEDFTEMLEELGVTDKEVFGRLQEEKTRVVQEQLDARLAATKKQQEAADKFWNEVGQKTKERDKAIAAQWATALQPAEDAINHFLAHGDNLRTFWRNLWYGMVQDYSAALVSMTARDTERALANKNITVASVATGAWADAQRYASYLDTNFKLMLLDAKKAATGAYAAIAGIPVVGPALAPIAAAAAFAGVMAWDVGGGFSGGGSAVGGLLSGGPTAAGGSAFGNATAGGGGGGGTAAPSTTAQPTSGPAATQSVTIYAMDSQSFVQFAKNNHAGFAAGVKAAIDNGSLTPRKMGRS